MKKNALIVISFSFFLFVFSIWSVFLIIIAKSLPAPIFGALCLIWIGFIINFFILRYIKRLSGSKIIRPTRVLLAINSPFFVYSPLNLVLLADFFYVLNKFKAQSMLIGLLLNFLGFFISYLVIYKNNLIRNFILEKRRTFGIFFYTLFCSMLLGGLSWGIVTSPFEPQFLPPWLVFSVVGVFLGFIYAFISYITLLLIKKYNEIKEVKGKLSK